MRLVSPKFVATVSLLTLSAATAQAATPVGGNRYESYREVAARREIRRQEADIARQLRLERALVQARLQGQAIDAGYYPSDVPVTGEFVGSTVVDDGSIGYDDGSNGSVEVYTNTVYPFVGTATLPTVGYPYLPYYWHHRGYHNGFHHGYYHGNHFGHGYSGHGHSHHGRG